MHGMPDVLSYSSEKYFNKGIAIGTEKDYYEDGSLKEQGSYKNNKETGVW